MDRRRFFSFFGLGGAAVSLTSLKAIAPLTPVEHAVEVRRDRQYLFVVSRRLPVETLRKMGWALERAGLKKPIVVDGGDEIEIYEVNGP